LERDEIQEALKIDQQQLEKLATILAKGSTMDKWFERAFGFVGGVFSSILASLIYDYFRNRRTAVPEVVSDQNGPKVP
jgi:hypothetical protein